MSQRGDRPAVPVLLALGSNLGDRRRHLESGLDFLSRRLRIRAVSRVVESAPWGPIEQPHFLNLVLRAETRLAPLSLLDVLQAAEEDAGRVRAVPQGPRTLDVDLVFYGSHTMVSPRLVIPHPAWSERPFVRDLVAEVAQDMVEPSSGRLLRNVAGPTGLSDSLREMEPLENSRWVEPADPEARTALEAVTSSSVRRGGTSSC